MREKIIKFLFRRMIKEIDLCFTMLQDEIDFLSNRVKQLEEIKIKKYGNKRTKNINRRGKSSSK